MVELQKRNEELDAFAHTVAHDLKNPAFVISGNAQLLLRDYATLPDDERQRHVKIIEQTGRRIGTIIDESAVTVQAAQVRSGDFAVGHDAHRR